MIVEKPFLAGGRINKSADKIISVSSNCKDGNCSRAVTDQSINLINQPENKQKFIDNNALDKQLKNNVFTLKDKCPDIKSPII